MFEGHDVAQCPLLQPLYDVDDPLLQPQLSAVHSSLFVQAGPSPAGSPELVAPELVAPELLAPELLAPELLAPELLPSPPVHAAMAMTLVTKKREPSRLIETFIGAPEIEEGEDITRRCATGQPFRNRRAALDRPIFAMDRGRRVRHAHPRGTSRALVALRAPASPPSLV